MKRKLTIILAAAFVLLGCNLTDTVTITAVPTATQWTPPTQPVQPTPQPQSSVAPAATAQPTTAAIATPVPVANCAPRADWSIYVVVPGDTLAAIAQRSDSTVASLVAANCLTNANTIFAGQQLRVPRQPVPPTPYPVPTSMDSAPRILSFRLATEANPPRLEWITWNASAVMLSVSGPRGAYIGYGAQPASGSFALPELGVDFAPRATFTLTMKDAFGRDVLGPNGLPVLAQVEVATGDAPLDCPTLSETGTGNILVSPVMGLVQRCSTVRPNQTLWVTWEGVSGLSSAEYYFMPTTASACGTPGVANVIGVDQNMADGNMITWYVGPGPCAGVLYAFGYVGETMVESRQHGLVIYSR